MGRKHLPKAVRPGRRTGGQLHRQHRRPRLRPEAAQSPQVSISYFSLRKLNEHLPDLVVPQFLNNQKFPGAIVRYLEGTDLKDVAGDRRDHEDAAKTHGSGQTHLRQKHSEMPQHTWKP